MPTTPASYRDPQKGWREWWPLSWKCLGNLAWQCRRRRQRLSWCGRRRNGRRKGDRRHHHLSLKQRGKSTPKPPSSDTWAALSTKMANPRRRPTTGAEQRGHASRGSPGSSSTGREHRGDLRFDCWELRRWRPYYTDAWRGPPAATTTGYWGGHTTDYSCELSGTAASAAPTNSFCTLRPSRRQGAKAGSYHSTTATSVRGSHGQTTRRAPPEAADGRKTRRVGRSRQGTPGAKLDGLSQGRLPSVRSHRRLYGGQPAHIRSRQSRMDPCGEDGRWGAVAQGGVAGSGKVHDLLAQGRRGGQPTTCDQTGLSWSWAPHTFVGRCREWPGRCKPGGEYTPA